MLNNGLFGGYKPCPLNRGIPISGFTTSYPPSPDDHIGHLLRRPEPLVVDPDDGNDPGDVRDELLIGIVELLKVLKGDGRLTLPAPHVHTPLALRR